MLTLLAACALAATAGCGSEAPEPAPKVETESAAQQPALGPGELAPFDGEPVRTERLDGGPTIEVMREGEGEPAPGDAVAIVLFRGILPGGTVFDASARRGGTLRVPLAGTGTIEGLKRGLAGARPGERRRIRIPAELAYGDSGRPPIPPRADLVFEVELVSWEPATAPAGPGG